MPHGSCAEPFARCKVPARVPAIGKRQEFVEDKARSNGDAGGNDPREDLGEADDSASTYSSPKTTVRKYKIPCLLSETSVVYQEGRVFGSYTVAHCWRNRRTAPSGKRPGAMREPYPPHTETAQRLVSALERVADALEGSVQRAGGPKSCG